MSSLHSHIQKKILIFFYSLDKGHFKLGRDTEPDVTDIGLVGNNKQQYNAIQRALTTSFSLIQGPPGNFLCQ